MHKRYALVGKTVTPSDEEGHVIDIFIEPDEAEKQEILKHLSFDEHTLSSALDANEVPRIEFEDDYTFLIWKRPKDYSADEIYFSVSSIGFILSPKRLIVILEDDYERFSDKEFAKVASPFEYLLKLLSYTVHHYVERVKEINLTTKRISARINTAVDNRDFIKMFDLGEDLVYYIDAIEANNAVLRKMTRNLKKLRVTPSEAEALDDLMIESTQCLRQAENYSTILSGLMDARGNIINNNVNVYMRRLTLINCIFLPLGLLAGIGGMSEFSNILAKNDINIAFGYALFIVAMVPVGWGTYLLFNRIAFTSSCPPSAENSSRNRLTK